MDQSTDEEMLTACDDGATLQPSSLSAAVCQLDFGPESPLYNGVATLIKHLGGNVSQEMEIIVANKDWEGAIREVIWSAISNLKQEHRIDATTIGRSILNIMHHLHCSDLKRHPPHIPLIVWQCNKSTGTCVYPGELKTSEPFTIQCRVKVAKVRHATNAAAFVQMLRPEGLLLQERRNTLPEKLADISTHGLLYCGLHLEEDDRNKLTHREASKLRYGAVVVTFDLDKTGNNFYILGTKYYPQEVAQQILCSTKAADWKAVFIDGATAKKTAGLVPLDMNNFEWNLGISQGAAWYGGKDRWIHPEIVYDGGVLIRYDKVKVSFLPDHECIQTKDGRHVRCVECQVYCHHSDYLGRVKYSHFDTTDSQRVSLDTFAIAMLENPEHWNAVVTLQQKFQTFHAPGLLDRDGRETQFVAHIERRMSHFRPILAATNEAVAMHQYK